MPVSRWTGPHFRVPSKTERLVTALIRWGIVSLIAVTGIKFNMHEKIFSLSVPLKTIIVIGIGLVCGVSLEISHSYFKDFLIRRRNKKKGFFICKTCNGNGWMPKASRHWFLRTGITKGGIHGICRACEGKGYVDWIENVVGGKGHNDVDMGPGQSVPGGSTSSV